MPLTLRKSKVAKKYQLSTEEQIATLTEALRLIRKPESWIKGKWRCPIYEKTPSGKLRMKNKDRVQETDSKGNPLYAYCLEGAINQAVYNLYGHDRAKTVGAWSSFGSDGGFEGDRFIYPTATISIDGLVWDMFKDEIIEARSYTFSTSATVNHASLLWQDMDETTHSDVLKVLRKKLRELKALVT